MAINLLRVFFMLIDWCFKQTVRISFTLYFKIAIEVAEIYSGNDPVAVKAV